jgi:hypothetical protein
MVSYKYGWRLMLSLIGLVIASASGPASAQVYRCSNGGSTYLSDRPCSGAPAGRLGMVGPSDRSAREPVGSSYIPPIGKAPEHLAYMSAECASLNDAIRTGPARGLKSSTMSDLQTEYSRKCREEESAAYQRLAQQRSEDRQEKQSREKAFQAQVSQAQRSREQCDELLRILAAKRRQVDGMNAGEKADFQRFEASYNARCKT